MFYPVFLCLIERILDQKLPRQGSNREAATVTLFQLWTYLEASGISDMKTHISDLAEEGFTHTHTRTHMLNAAETASDQ